MRPSDLPVDDLLLQLGEESGELTQATSKYVRKRRGNNPTPLTYNDCLKSVLEEIADVQVATEALLECLGLKQESLESMRRRKRERWQERLNQS